MNTACALSNEILCENYAWVDAMLEEKFYDYVIQDNDDTDIDYDTCEHYAWVDSLLEEQFYDYIIQDDDNIHVNYETFGDQDQDQDQDNSDFSLLIRDLKIIIDYHEDRRQRRMNAMRFSDSISL